MTVFEGPRCGSGTDFPMQGHEMSLPARPKSPRLGLFDTVPGGLEAYFHVLFIAKGPSGPYDGETGLRGTLFSK